MTQPCLPRDSRVRTPWYRYYILVKASLKIADDQVSPSPMETDLVWRGPVLLDILLIDDDQLIRDSIRLLLTYEDFKVQAAATGGEAIQLSESRPFDLVIFDIKMADMDGFACIERLRGRLPGAHFVMITGCSQEGAQLIALRLGIEDYFQKPFEMEHFLRRIRSLLSNRHPLERLVAHLSKRPDFLARRELLWKEVCALAERQPLQETQWLALRFAAFLQPLVGDLPIYSGAVPAIKGTGLLETTARILVHSGSEHPSSDGLAEIFREACHKAIIQPGQEEPGADSPDEEDNSLPEEPEGSLPPGRLQVFTLGTFRVLYRNQEVTLQRNRWLFLYLISHLASRKGKWLTCEFLRDLFWPESELEKAQHCLVSCIYRLRKAFQDTNLIERGELGYRIAPECSLEWDAHLLQELHEESLQLADPTPKLRQIESLYHGDFAPGCLHDWAEWMRDKFQRIAQSSLERLGNSLLEIDPAAAEERARRALALQSTSEAAAKLLIKALWKQGRRDEAARHFQSFSAHIEEELGLPPDEELHEIHRSLVSAGSLS